MKKEGQVSEIDMMARVADSAAQRAGARLVLMCGISGSGKTSLLQAMESELGYRRVSMDEIIWDRYGELFTQMSAAERAEVFLTASRELEQRTEAALLSTPDARVVVDATMCKSVRRRAMRGLAARCGTVALVVYLQAPPAVLRARLSHRCGLGPHDQIIPDADLTDFCRNFQPPQSAHLLLL